MEMTRPPARFPRRHHTIQSTLPRRHKWPPGALLKPHLSYLLVIGLHECVYFNPQGLRVHQGIFIVTDPL